MWEFDEAIHWEFSATKKMHSGMEVREVYGQSIGRYVASREAVYETEATEQTANTLRESEHSASHKRLRKRYLSSDRLGRDRSSPIDQGDRVYVGVQLRFELLHMSLNNGYMISFCS